MPRLILNAGGADERAFELRRGETSIGRTKDNDVYVLHTSLSRRHAKLEYDGARAVIVDLESKNGTFVEGERVQTRELRSGDRVRCGEIAFEFVDENAPAAERGPKTIASLAHDTTHVEIDALLGRGRAGTSLKISSAPTAGDAHDKLQVLLKVAQLLASPRPIDALLGEVLDLVLRIMDVDRAALLLVDPATGELVPRVLKAARGDPPGRFYSENIVRWVRDNGVPALFADARVDERVGAAASILAQSICSSMCAPLKPKDSLLGVLYVDNLTTPDRFAEADLEFLGAFANQAAIAIEAALLHKRLEEEAVKVATLTRFFPPTTIKRLANAGGGALEMIETEVTALFSDITGFTAMSTRMRPRDVVALLNDYFPPMADIVFSHGGTLEKYIGDALMAVWGAPFHDPDDADRAVRAAVDMQRALGALNARFAERGRPEIRIHVGINTGVVAAGNIGSEHYLQYATIGDATNVASRACSAAAAGEIVVTESTRARLRDARWKLEARGPTPVKGKDEPLDLYAVRWEA
jgi:adenylate cyclase